MMYTDRQQPVTQPSSDETDGGGSHSKFAAGDGPWHNMRRGASENNTSQSVQAVLQRFDQWREVLRRPNVRRRLLSDLDPSEVIHYFHYMPQADEQQITSRQRNNGRTSGVEIFLDVLGRLGEPSWPEDFCQVLRDNGQRHLADLLETEHIRVQSNSGRCTHEHLRAGLNSARKMRYTPTIPPEQLDAMLQYSDLWKATIRREKRLLRENVDPTAISMYLPYLSNKVDEKVRATYTTQGPMRAMDVFIDDGLMYVGDQNWPNDLCYALKKVNQGYVAEDLKKKFMELLHKGETGRYSKLAHFIRTSSTFGVNFGEMHSSDIR